MVYEILKTFKKQDDSASDLENRVVEVARSAVEGYLLSQQDSGAKRLQELAALQGKIQEQVDSASKILSLLEEIKAGLALQMGNVNLEREVLVKLKSRL